jgi:tetratricopeptide (TPR) repeat protein
MDEFKPKVRHSSQETISSKMQRGDNLLQARNFRDALELFTEIIEQDPDVTKAYLYASQAALGLKLYDVAFNHTKEALRRNPMSTAATLLMGKIYLAQENWSEALAYFQDAIQLDPKSAAAYAGLGEVAYYLQDYEQAIAMFRQATDLAPNYARAYTSIAKAYIAQQNQGNLVLNLDVDTLDFMERNSYLGVLEEDAIWQMVGSSSPEELEEQLTELQYVQAWLQPLLEEVQWQIEFLQKVCGSSRKMIIPEGMAEGFENSPFQI